MGRGEGSGWGTHVYLWRIYFNIWQNQYNIVKFKNKIKFKKYIFSKKKKKKRKENLTVANCNKVTRNPQECATACF